MDIRLFGISSLLLLGGCLATAPVMHQIVDDPFHLAPVLAMRGFDMSEDVSSHTEAQRHEEEDTPTVSPGVYASPSETTNVGSMEELDEFTFEPESATIISDDEQVQLLSSNQWIRNTALINLLDTGRNLTSDTISSEERKRRDEINRLNKSKDELARQNDQRYEYIDGLASDWRWMHRGVDQLIAVPPSQRADPAVFLRDRKYRDTKYKTLRANAAILMGRAGDARVGQYLLQLVQDEKTANPIRCAAMEVLGRLPTITVADLLPLLEKVKERDVEIKDRKTGEVISQRQTGNLDVWSELLTAIAEKINPWEHPCFLEPLNAATSDIRLETVKIWRRKASARAGGDSPPINPPERFLEFAKREANPMVRVEIIKTLGAFRISELFPLLEKDLHPQKPVEVRQAAMNALGDVKCQEAIPIIKDQLRDSNYNTRVVAVSALCKLDALDDVFKKADDPHQLVRVEVAKAFAKRCTRQTANLAKEYLSDRYAPVQLATVEAIAGWCIEDSGPLLLEAAKSNNPNTRRRATEILAERGVSSSLFNPEDQPQNQTVQHDELKEIFYETVGVDPDLQHSSDRGGNREKTVIPAPDQGRGQALSGIQTENSNPALLAPRLRGGDGKGGCNGKGEGDGIENNALTEIRRCLDDWQDRTLPQDQRQLIQRRLTAHRERLMPMIDHLMTVENRSIPESLDKVFAEVDPMFKEIEKMKSDDPLTKKKAAQELARSGVASSPSKLAAKRIVDLVPKQTDANIHISLLNALKNADPDLVCQLARPLLQSESVQVRRLSCEMLKQFGGSEDVPLLREALRDPSREVVRGALSAIDELVQEEEDVDVSSVVDALKAMLHNSGDPGLQTDVAATLHRLGRTEGTEALRRLAVSNDARVKVYVIRVVSELNDAGFVPMLIRFLDDPSTNPNTNASLRNEALKGLPKLTGKDIGRIGGLTYASDFTATQQQIDRWKAWAKEQGI